MSVKLAKRLVEPDYWTCPQHATRQRPEPFLTYGPEVAELNAAIGFEPDAQQELGLDLLFAIRPDGSPASFEFCVICCRQNLKTGLFKQAAIGWLFVTDQPLIVWSAHEMTTTNEAQRDLANLMLDSPMLNRRMMRNNNQGIYYANGEERIELANGQRCMFKARTKDGGRGLAAPKLILDEAFAVRPSMMGALLPLMLAQKDPQVVYGSSAGKEDSDVLFDLRDRGRNAISPAMTYLEWLSPQEDCSDPKCSHPKDAVKRGIDCALDREHLIRKANPAISTGRINIETVRNLRQALPPEEYARECLGWWDEQDTAAPPSVIPADIWDPLVSPGPAQNVAPSALGVDMSHDRVVAIAGCWLGEPSHVELLELGQVFDPLGAVEWLFERADRRIPIVIDEYSPAASMVPQLKARRMRVIVTRSNDLAKACGAFFDDVTASQITHAGQAQLDAAVAGAQKRAIGKAGGWGWDRTDAAGNIAPLVAVTLARYGATLVRRRARSSDGEGRRAVVL